MQVGSRRGVAACLVLAGLMAVWNSVTDRPTPIGPIAQQSHTHAADATNPPTGRVADGLLVLYDFRNDDGQAGSGKVVKDRAGQKTRIDLEIANPKAVTWTSAGLQVKSSTVIRTPSPPKSLTGAIKRAGEITLEAWITPANTSQEGPARILTLSRDTTNRNFTLGQERDKYDVRFRTTKTDRNGMPSLATGSRSVKTKLTHVVYTRRKSGEAALYLDGKRTNTKTVAGNLSNMDDNFLLAVANETTGDRAWLGTLSLVAVYNRALSREEVARNFAAGARGRRTPEQIAAANRRKSEQMFLSQVAPLISNHCLECHDVATHKGGLDLSQHKTTLAGGETGPAVVPGKVDDSLLWHHIDANEMPLKRTPLTTAEKAILKNWIAAGAVWSGGMIDPSAYTHGNQASERWVQRLTIREYITTVQQTVGVDIADDARKLLPPDLRADGFSNTAYNLNVDLKHVQAYAQLAEIITSRMDIKAFARKFSRDTKLTDNSMRGLIAKMGPWLLRGPLANHEVDVYRGISTTVASAGGDFEEAVRLIVEAMLQSPRFIYRIENHRGDGTAWPVGQYELASRLSFMLQGGPPGEALYAAAEKGQLTRDGVRSHAERLLKSPQAIARSQQFITEWLNLNRLQNLRPNAKHFPDWNPELAADMREETLAFAKHILHDQNRPLADLLNADVSFMTGRLARHYGLKPNGDKTAQYDLKAVPARGGLLTQGSVLTVGGDEASMVSRGLFVMHDLLRGVVKDPPPCVNTTPVPTKPGLTQRAIAEGRIANQSCGGCHQKFEPLAFGLEKFDGLGAFHEKDEHGNVLKEDGNILFPGSAKAIPYKTSAELMDLLADSDRVKKCLTWKLAQFALGRPLASTDMPILDEIHNTAMKNGGRYQDVMTALVTSDLVLRSKTEAVK